jgi:UDP-N-acetyl-L-fucosamine synthase
MPAFRLPRVPVSRSWREGFVFRESVRLVIGLEPDDVLRSLELLKDQTLCTEWALHLVREHGMPNVSEKMLRVILIYASYADYVNRYVGHR